ncbi:MAG: PASTA domain-containing protein [Coriobacteriales bacterium]|jgi:serine/threonine-protein kinase|nr:PASTA domain-containing protein [Coriobacteriales bacterium]
MKAMKALEAVKESGLRLKLVVLVLSLSLAASLVGCSSCSTESKDNPDPASDKLEVSDVVNMTKDDAIRVIMADDFKLGSVSEEASETVPLGNVVSQDPKPGTEVKPGTTINLVVSKGSDKPPEQVAVPDLTGMTQTQAEQALIAAKLVPTPGNPEYAAGIEPGKVFKQSVAAGSSVEAGSTVGFTAALGSETIAVPNVTGLTKDNAIKALAAAGFGVDAHDEYNASVAAGNVIAQNPYAKVVCVKGTTVYLSVSAGPVPAGKVKVPDLATLAMPQAISICNSAGLVLDPAGSDLNGTVVSQYPAPNTMVEKGTKITAQFEPVFLGS